MLKTCIEKLIQSESLSEAELISGIDDMLLNLNREQSAAFLALLRRKRETSHEIAGLGRYLRQKMQRLEVSKPVLDIVGTGGDGFNTVNISTASSLLAASCGVVILKNGNRSVSSLTGSADLLEAYGYDLEITESLLLESLEKYHFGFCYAPVFHQAFAAIKPIRKQLGIPTIFNLIGPLLNPAEAKYMLMGVGDKRYLEIMADALLEIGVERALVFNGCGLDEISTVGSVDVIELNRGKKLAYRLNPREYGFKTAKIEDLKGGDVHLNQRLISEVLQGKPGSIADTLILNAGMASYLYGLCDNPESGIELARSKHQTGEAYRLLEKVVSHSRGGNDA